MKLEFKLILGECCPSRSRNYMLLISSGGSVSWCSFQLGAALAVGRGATCRCGHERGTGNITGQGSVRGRWFWASRGTMRSPFWGTVGDAEQ